MVEWISVLPSFTWFAVLVTSALRASKSTFGMVADGLWIALFAAAAPGPPSIGVLLIVSVPLVKSFVISLCVCVLPVAAWAAPSATLPVAAAFAAASWPAVCALALEMIAFASAPMLLNPEASAAWRLLPLVSMCRRVRLDRVDARSKQRLQECAGAAVTGEHAFAVKRRVESGSAADDENIVARSRLDGRAAGPGFHHEVGDARVAIGDAVVAVADNDLVVALEQNDVLPVASLHQIVDAAHDHEIVAVAELDAADCCRLPPGHCCWRC